MCFEETRSPPPSHCFCLYCQRYPSLLLPLSFSPPLPIHPPLPLFLSSFLGLLSSPPPQVTTSILSCYKVCVRVCGCAVVDPLVLPSLGGLLELVRWDVGCEEQRSFLFFILFYFILFYFILFYFILFSFLFFSFLFFSFLFFSFLFFSFLFFSFLYFTLLFFY